MHGEGPALVEEMLCQDVHVRGVAVEQLRAEAAKLLEIGIEIDRREMKGGHQEIVVEVVVTPEGRFLLLQRHYDVAAHDSDRVSTSPQPATGPAELPVQTCICRVDRIGVVADLDR